VTGIQKAVLSLNIATGTRRFENSISPVFDIETIAFAGTRKGNLSLSKLRHPPLCRSCAK
jgi:hypothetical protein